MNEPQIPCLFGPSIQLQSKYHIRSVATPARLGRVPDARSCKSLRALQGGDPRIFICNVFLIQLYILQEKGNANAQAWSSAIQSAVGDGWQRLGLRQLSGMLVLVYIRSDLLVSVTPSLSYQSSAKLMGACQVADQRVLELHSLHASAFYIRRALCNLICYSHMYGSHLTNAGPVHMLRVCCACAGTLR